MKRYLQIRLVLFTALLLVGCQPPTVVEVEELRAMQVLPGSIMPILPKEANVTFANGQQGILEISWDVQKGQEGSAQVWEDMTIKGYIKSGPGKHMVTQLIEVVQLETSEPLAEEIAPLFSSGLVTLEDRRDPMEHLAKLEVNWSGTEISLELKEELRALLFRAQWITMGNFAGNTINVIIDQEMWVDGQVFFPANDHYFYTYKDLRDFIEATYTGDLLDRFIEAEKCLEIDGVLYYWGCDGLGFSYGREGPWRMNVQSVTDDRIIVQLSQIVVYPENISHEDVSIMEFLFVNGRWLISQQGFQI